MSEQSAVTYDYEIIGRGWMGQKVVYEKTLKRLVENHDDLRRECGDLQMVIDYRCYREIFHREWSQPTEKETLEVVTRRRKLMVDFNNNDSAQLWDDYIAYELGIT